MRVFTPVYLIGLEYEGSEDKAYSAIETMIERLGEAQKILNTTWIVHSAKRTAQIFQDVSECVEEGDQVFVVRVHKDAKWSTFSIAQDAWLLRHLRA